MDNWQLKNEYRNPDNCQSSIVYSSLLRKAKRQGFSDFQIARAFGLEGNMKNGMMQIRQFRKVTRHRSGSETDRYAGC